MLSVLAVTNRCLHLRSLRFFYVPLSLDVLSSLRGLSLTELWVQYCGAKNESCAVIATSCPQLVSLYISGNKMITVVGIGCLARYLRKLRCLYIDQVSLTPENLKAVLAENDAFPDLVTLFTGAPFYSLKQWRNAVRVTHPLLADSMRG